MNPTVRIPESHATNADSRHVHASVSELRVLHCFLLFCFLLFGLSCGSTSLRAYTESVRKQCKEFFLEGRQPLQTSPRCTLFKQIPYYAVSVLRLRQRGTCLFLVDRFCALRAQKRSTYD